VAFYFRIQFYIEFTNSVNYVISHKRCPLLFYYIIRIMILFKDLQQSRNIFDLLLRRVKENSSRGHKYRKEFISNPEDVKDIWNLTKQDFEPSINNLVGFVTNRVKIYVKILNTVISNISIKRKIYMTKGLGF
jgi:hypothetical protein